MFKKAAEEYATHNDWFEFSANVDKIGNAIRTKIERAYIAGAKFCYNKANEWHYVKDGDLPKETGLLISKTLLLVTKMKGSDCLSLALGEYNFSTQEFSYQHIVGLTDVIAWKEIVLPKEIE